MRKVYGVEVGETLVGRLAITFVEIKGNKEGPTVVVVSGIHGDEVSSIGGLQLFLDDLEAAPPEEISGRVIALPFANPFALMAVTRDFGLRKQIWSDDQNLNRIFPGSTVEDLGDRLAHVIYREITMRKPAVVIDLHTTTVTRSLPFVIIDRVKVDASLSQRLWQYAEAFGLGVVHDFPDEEYESEGLDSSLSACMLQKGIPSFTVEVPGGFVSEETAENVVRCGLRNIVELCGITKKELRSEWWMPASSRSSKKLLGVGNYCRSSGYRTQRAGFFRPCTKAGEWVRKGDRVGIVLDAGFRAIEKVSARADGILSYFVEHSIVSTGDDLYELLVPEKRDPQS